MMNFSTAPRANINILRAWCRYITRETQKSVSKQPETTMEGIKQQGRKKEFSAGGSNIRGMQLYEIGPLRLQEHSLKTVKAYVSRGHLQHNARVIRGRCGEQVKLCAMVKANGYGHDAKMVVSALNGGQVDGFAVSSIEEAEQIYPFVQGRGLLVTCPFFAGMDPELVRLAQMRSFHGTLCTVSALEYLNKTVRAGGPRLKLHVKVETGMGRLGCGPDELGLLVNRINATGSLVLAGVYSHFASADDADLSYTYLQLDRFNEVLLRNGLDRQVSVVKHAANTSATWRVTESHYDMVRCGLGLYGYLGYDNTGAAPVGLRPVLRVEAPVVQIKRLAQGQSCGYGRSYIAPRDMVIGVVPVGYADGLFRQLSNRACMRYGDRKLPIIGRISMDLTIVDLTEVRNPSEGMSVVVMDDQADSYAGATGLARLAGTIPYEILTGIGNRVKRVLCD